MNWLKKIFAQRKTISEVQTWVNEQRFELETELKKYADIAMQELANCKGAIKEALENLEEAELRNPDIPERAKHFMQGNREQLNKLTTRFIEEVFIPNTRTELVSYVALLERYASQSARPFAILSEFFGDEVKVLRKNLAYFESLGKPLLVIDVKLNDVELVQDCLNRIEVASNEKIKCDESRMNLVQEQENLQKQQVILKQEKELILQKPEYVAIKDEILHVVSERQSAEHAITSLFHPIQDSIKKYAHKIKNTKLAKYGENALDALIHDYDLSLLKYCDEITKSLEKEELSTKNVSEALDALKKCTRENLGKLIHRYANAKKCEAEIATVVANKPVMQDFERSVENARLLALKIEEVILKLERLKGPDILSLQNELQKLLEKQGIIIIT